MGKCNFLLLAVLTGLCVACSQESSLERALRLSGGNREHLEQVLAHYSCHPEDSLRYRAACFLIANMPGHGWYEGEALDQYRNWVDSAYRHRDIVFRAVLHEAFFLEPGAVADLKRREDVECIDSNFLIAHIDSAFSAIARRPWLENLSFGQLCEYILPYRVGNEPPQLLFRLQDSLFRADMADLLKYDDVATDPAGLFAGYRPDLRYADGKTVRLCYRGKFVDRKVFDCFGEAVARGWWGRLLLFPVATDFNPAFPDRNDRHYWPVMIDNRQLNGITSLSFESNRHGKIYRRTFAHNACPDTSGGQFVPPFFRTPFLRDVTSLYGPVTTVEVSSRIPLATPWGYLCVFNDLTWTPVAFGKAEDGNFSFSDVGTGVAYLPVAYPGQEAVAVSWPFILHTDGHMQVLRPDTTNLSVVRLRRKYPLKYQNRMLNRQFAGAVVEASDDPSFRRCDSVGCFREVTEEQWATAGISSPRAYRFWRIRSGSFFTIAECCLRNSGGEEIKPLLTDGDRPQLYFGGFDGDPLSYTFPDQTFSFRWDMGKPAVLAEIECLLRNDGNNIWPGHWYQLSYHDGEGWYSLGVKKAADRFVEFSGVPANALLWLRDLTTGREERIFTCRDGKVRFW